MRKCVFWFMEGKLCFICYGKWFKFEVLLVIFVGVDIGVFM